MSTETREPEQQYQSSFRMDEALGKRLKLVAAVTGLSINQLIVNGVRAMVMDYEGDPSFQKRRVAWLNEMTG